jgi:hypothetical protein
MAGFELLQDMGVYVLFVVFALGGLLFAIRGTGSPYDEIDGKAVRRRRIPIPFRETGTDELEQRRAERRRRDMARWEAERRDRLAG